MKQAWVSIQPWNKDLAIAALEAGADAVVLDPGDAARMAELGRMRVVAADGDIKLGADVVRIAIESKQDEQRAAAVPADKTVILALSDWRIIPLENLLAQRGKLMVEVGDAEDARAVMQTLEKGADGIVITSRTAPQVRRMIEEAHAVAETVPLETAKITEVRRLGMGDRVCIDTTTNMGVGRGMLVGNASSGFFLVHSESVDNPYVAARPFRVNAGAVHAYVLVPGGKTRYLNELHAGDETLVVGYDGRTEIAYVGRCKIERRPLLMVSAEASGASISLVLQNAETIRLTRPDGQPISVVAVGPGDEILVHRAGGGRHFGMKIDETLREV